MYRRLLVVTDNGFIGVIVQPRTACSGGFFGPYCTTENPLLALSLSHRERCFCLADRRRIDHQLPLAKYWAIGPSTVNHSPALLLQKRALVPWAVAQIPASLTIAA